MRYFFKSSHQFQRQHYEERKAEREKGRRERHVRREGVCVFLRERKRERGGGSMLKRALKCSSASS